MNKTLEKQLLTIIEVIKKMQIKLDNAVSYDTEIQELQTLIDKIDKNTNNSLNTILKTIEPLNDKIDKTYHQETLQTIKSELMDYIKTIDNKIKEVDIKGEIDRVVKDYATKNELDNELKNILKEIKTEKIIETIKEETKFIEPNIKVGKVKTVQPGTDASVEIRKTKDIYYLDFYIPRGVSGKGTAGPPGTNGTDGIDGTNGEGVPIGGTTNQILAKNSNADYDTKWVDNSGGTTTTAATETITLTATNISNKYVDLTNTPNSPTTIDVFPNAGIRQVNAVDYEVITNGTAIKRLSWNGLGLDGILAENDLITVSYWY